MSATCMCLRDSLKLLFLRKTSMICNSDAKNACLNIGFGIAFIKLRAPRSSLQCSMLQMTPSVLIEGDEIKKHSSVHSNTFARHEYVYIKEANFYASQTYQKQHIYPSIKQYRNDQERNSILRLIAIVLYNISKSFLSERGQTFVQKKIMRDRNVLYKLY